MFENQIEANYEHGTSNMELNMTRTEK